MHQITTLYKLKDTYCYHTSEYNKEEGKEKSHVPAKEIQPAEAVGEKVNHEN